MPPAEDWTRGPAKWAAVALLGIASIGGLCWSVLTRPPHPAPLIAAPTLVSGPPQSDPQPTGPTAEPRNAPETAARLVNINTAGPKELELLPGIGPALAARIVEHRTAHGPFRSIDDLDQVKGIGPRTLERLRPLITLE